MICFICDVSLVGVSVIGSVSCYVLLAIDRGMCDVLFVTANAICVVLCVM